MKPRVSLWLIVAIYVLFTTLLPFAVPATFGGPAAVSILCALAAAAWVAWLLGRHIQLIRAINHKQAFAARIPQMQGGLHFASMDGKCAIAINPDTMQVALVDANNNVAICGPRQIISFELEVDKIDGTDYGGRAAWVGPVGGFSASSLESDRVKSVSLRIVADDMRVSSVNIYFLKNRRHLRIRGRFAEAVDMARAWEDRMTVFTGDFDVNSETMIATTDNNPNSRQKTTWKKGKRR